MMDLFFRETHGHVLADGPWFAFGSVMCGRCARYGSSWGLGECDGVADPLRLVEMSPWMRDAWEGLVSSAVLRDRAALFGGV